MCSFDMYDENELYARHDAYGTPNSYLLKEVRDAGFKPIGITVLMCEETFIFKSGDEAKQAAEKFLPEGWWYGIDGWEHTYNEYVDRFYGGDKELATPIHWLDANYAPKTKNV
jgi:hypothetical protein